MYVNYHPGISEAKLARLLLTLRAASAPHRSLQQRGSTPTVRSGFYRKAFVYSFQAFRNGGWRVSESERTLCCGQMSSHLQM